MRMHTCNIMLNATSQNPTSKKESSSWLLCSGGGGGGGCDGIVERVACPIMTYSDSRLGKPNRLFHDRRS